MDLNLEIPGRHLFIRAISDRGIRIGDSWLQRSFLIAAESLEERWPPQSMDDLEEGHLDAIAKLEPEVVLFGTGAQQVFLEPKMMMHFYSRGMGLEVMGTEAACRSFHVLISEVRNVVAAMMPITHDGTG